MRFASNVTSGVSGVNAAASFDKEAILARGHYMGKEFYGKGVHVQLGPAMNFMRYIKVNHTMLSPFFSHKFSTLQKR